MKTSLNPARLGADSLSFTEFVDLAARHGFDGVDIGIGSAMRAGNDLGGSTTLNDYFKNKGVAPAVFNLDVEWRKDNETFEQGMATLAAKAAFAEQINCTRCVTWIPPSTNQSHSDWERGTARRFGEIAHVLSDNGVRFGLEWVGPHHLRAGAANAMGTNPSLFTLDQTLALIDRIGNPNVGLLVDSYHCYTTGIGEAELAALSDSLIVHAHINDAPKGVGPTGARDGERILPGLGEINLAGFLRGLQKAGYQGFVAAEILAQQNLAPTPDEAANAVRASLRTLGL